MLVGVAIYTSHTPGTANCDCVNCQSHRAYVYILPSLQGGMAYTALAVHLNAHTNRLQKWLKGPDVEVFTLFRCVQVKTSFLPHPHV